MGEVSTSQPKLRLITYLSPGIPVGLYQVYQRFLEEKLGVESFLIVESRWSGPPKDRVDPFTLNEVDIGFVCSSYFLRMKKEKNQWCELLPAAPIHIHPKSELLPNYFSDVIMHSSKSDNYKEFIDLKGHRWAYNDEESLSGNLVPLLELKKMGANASFFGHILHSGSHLNSISMVLNSTVDAAAIDSSVLTQYLLEHPEAKDKLHVLCSWGPWPIPPVVVNSRLPAATKEKLNQALLDMNKEPAYQAELAKYNVWGFKPVDLTHYDTDLELFEDVKGESIKTVYY